MECKYCKRIISNIGSMVKHEKCCKLNPNRISYSEITNKNLSKHREKMKAGLVKGQNQYTKAKINGETIYLSDEERNKRAERAKKLVFTPEIREILSLKRSKFLEEKGAGGFKYIKWYKVSNILSEEYIVRGSWELKVAKWLNENNILWKRKVYLKYEKEGVKRTYTPDFYLPITDQYIEVKGYFSKSDKEKLDLVQTQNKINLLVWFDEDIKQLETKLALVSPLSYIQ